MRNKLDKDNKMVKRNEKLGPRNEKTRPRNRKRVREMKKADLVPSDQLPESIRDFGVDIVPDLVPDLVPSGQPQQTIRDFGVDLVCTGQPQEILEAALCK